MRISVGIFSLLLCFALVIVDMRQIFEYKNLEGEVLTLERRKMELMARRKQLLTSISVMSSFGRLESIAQERLKLKKADPNQIKKIILLTPKKADHEN